MLETKLLFSVSCLNVSQFLEAWDGQQTLPVMGGRDLVSHGHAGQHEGTSSFDFAVLYAAQARGRCKQGRHQHPGPEAAPGHL